MPGSSGQPTRMEYPSPRGVHVPETYTAYPYPTSPSVDYNFDGSDRGPGGSARSGGPHKNRYSRSQQTPRIRDVTWISSPEQQPPSTIVQSPQLQPHTHTHTQPYTQHTPTQTQFPTPRGSHVIPSSPWRAPPSPLQAPRSPSPSHSHSHFAHSPSRAPSLSPRPVSPFRPSPSPAPTVGEHMELDEAAFALTLEEMLDSYGYQRPPSHTIGGGGGLMKSLWKGLKRLGTGFRRTSSFGYPNMSMPVPIEDMPMPIPIEMSGEEMPVPMQEMPVPIAAHPGQPPSEATQYIDPPSATPTPPETSEEQHSPHARSTHSRARSYTRTPRVSPGLLRRSRTSSPRVDADMPPVTVTIVSPTESPSPSPMPSPSPSSMPIPSPAWTTQSARRKLPSKGVPRHPSIRTPEEDNTPGRMPTPVPAPAPMPVAPPVVLQSSSGPGEDPIFSGEGAPRGVTFDMPVPIAASIPMPQPHPLSLSSGPLSSTVMARVRRFATKLDGLPWVSDTQIVEAYVPEANPRSQLRTRVRQGADPSWYNARPEEVGKPHGLHGPHGHGYEYNYDWSGWDMWAKQSAAGLLEEMRMGMHGTEGLGLQVMPEAPVYPHGYAPVIPHSSGFPVYSQPVMFGDRVIP